MRIKVLFGPFTVPPSHREVVRAMRQGFYINQGTFAPNIDTEADLLDGLLQVQAILIDEAYTTVDRLPRVGDLFLVDDQPYLFHGVGWYRLMGPWFITLPSYPSSPAMPTSVGTRTN